MAAERRRRLILVALNEINFDIARPYVDKLGLAAFRRLLDGHGIRTTSEEQYDLLEPWIQWPSIHTGLSAADHGIFRLGDIVQSAVPQYFEQLEERGIRVGSVSAMNAANRLRSPAYFIPDPWTQTTSDRSWWSRNLTSAISQAVNDNAQSRITLKSAIAIGLALLRFARLRHYGIYAWLATRSRGAPWRKALFLDLLLHDVHFHLFHRTNAEFSTIFLNAGAHIQHHYFFCSPHLRSESATNPSWYVAEGVDPLAEMLRVYDRIVADYVDLRGTEIIFATGLSQRPYDRAKYYYRLRDHASFLTSLGIAFKRVVPRMTRDFLMEFDSQSDAEAAVKRLKACRIAGSGAGLFGDIDNRGLSVFAALTYPGEIGPSTQFALDGRRPEPLLPHVAFVALKNGMHQSLGFAFFTAGVNAHAPADGDHVKALHTTVMAYLLRGGKHAVQTD